MPSASYIKGIQDQAALEYYQDFYDEALKEIKAEEEKATEEGKPLDLEFYTKLYVETLNKTTLDMAGEGLWLQDFYTFKVSHRLNIIASEIAYMVIDKEYRLNRNNQWQKR